MRLFFRRGHGRETINWFFFLCTLYWTRFFFGDFSFVHHDFPEFAMINNFERLFSIVGFIALYHDFIYLSLWLFKYMISVGFFFQTSIIHFKPEQFLDVLNNGFSPLITVEWQLHYVYVGAILVFGLSFLLRLFADRQRLKIFDRVFGSLSVDPDSRGQSVFFYWLGKNTGRNFDLALIVLIGFGFEWNDAPLSAWFFFIGAFSLFVEDSIIGSIKYREGSFLPPIADTTSQGRKRGCKRSELVRF